MYDIEIVVPAELEFKQRFIDFKNHGILNILQLKIHTLGLLIMKNGETKNLKKVGLIPLEPLVHII